MSIQEDPSNIDSSETSGEKNTLVCKTCDEEFAAPVKLSPSPMYRGAIIVLGVAIFQELDWLPVRFAVVAAGITAVAMEQHFKYKDNNKKD